jgi:hypothetical protein
VTAGHKGHVFVITVRMPEGANAVHTLRAVLKRLWRDYGVKCVGIEEGRPQSS